ncbi:hypothetical protein Tco_1456244 [Tanacetum coccineum]
MPISWKKIDILAMQEADYCGNSTTEAEYVAAANCCGQSTLSVIKNPVAHSRTKHIEIRFHFIRDCYKKRLIEVIKIHTGHNVADLLTKGVDVTTDIKLLVVSIRMISMDLRMDRSWAANSSYSWSVRDVVPLLPAMLAGVVVDQGEGLAQPAEPHHTPVDPTSPPHQSPPHPSPPPHSPHQSPPLSPHQSPPFSQPHY